MDVLIARCTVALTAGNPVATMRIGGRGATMAGRTWAGDGELLVTGVGVAKRGRRPPLRSVYR